MQSFYIYISQDLNNPDKHSFINYINIIKRKEARQYLLLLRHCDIKQLSKLVVSAYSLLPTNERQKIQLSDYVLFGFKLRNISGNSIINKFKRLLDEKYITQKLTDLFISFSETNRIAEKGKNYTRFTSKNHANKFKAAESKYPIFYVSSEGARLVQSKIHSELELLSKMAIKDIESGKYLVGKNNKYISLKDTKLNKEQSQFLHIKNKNYALESIANNENFTFLFVTLTLPSQFKPAPMSGNYNYEKNTTVKDGVNFLSGIWNNFNSQLSHISKKRYKCVSNNLEDIEISKPIFGFHCKEPQRDGTPHSHYLIYCHPNDQELIEKMLLHCCRSKHKSNNYRFDPNYSIKIKKESDYKPDAKGKLPSRIIIDYMTKLLNVSSEEIIDTPFISMTKTKNAAYLAQKIHKIRRFSFFGDKGIFSKWHALKVISLQKQLLESTLDKISKTCAKNTLSNFKKLIICIQKNDHLGFIKYVSKVNIQFEYKTTINRFQEEVKTSIGLILKCRDKVLPISSNKRYRLVKVQS